MDHPYSRNPDTNCCRTCGYGQHCTACGQGHSVRTTHLVRDKTGHYFICQEPARWERQLRARQIPSPTA